MKLRTEMEGTCVHARGMCVDEWDVLPEQAEDLQCDAAAAHALMQSITDAEDRWFVNQKDHTDWIKKKACELMREWGFE